MIKRETELKNIIKCAIARRATAMKRLERAQHRRDDAACDRIYAVLAYENELISNANNDLYFLQARDFA